MGRFELFRHSPWALLAALLTYVAGIVLVLLVFFGGSDYWTRFFAYADVHFSRAFSPSDLGLAVAPPAHRAQLVEDAGGSAAAGGVG